MPWPRCGGQKVTSWCPSLPPWWSHASNPCDQPLLAEPFLWPLRQCFFWTKCLRLWTLLSGVLIHRKFADLSRTVKWWGWTRAKEMVLSPKSRKSGAVAHHCWKVEDQEIWVLCLHCTFLNHFLSVCFSKKNILALLEQRNGVLILFKRRQRWPLLFHLLATRCVYCLMMS